MGKGGMLSIGCKLCIMWDVRSQEFEDGKDSKSVFHTKAVFRCLPKQIPTALSLANTPGLSFSRSCSRLTKFLERVMTPEEITSPSRSWERPGSHCTMRPAGTLRRAAWLWAAKPYTVKLGAGALTSPPVLALPWGWK